MHRVESWREEDQWGPTPHFASAPPCRPCFYPISAGLYKDNWPDQSSSPEAPQWLHHPFCPCCPLMSCHCNLSIQKKKDLHIFSVVDSHWITHSCSIFNVSNFMMISWVWVMIRVFIYNKEVQVPFKTPIQTLHKPFYSRGMKSILKARFDILIKADF